MFPHVWNRLGDQYFDITAEWIRSKTDEIVGFLYSPAFEYTTDEFPVGSAFEFNTETTSLAAAANEEMEKDDTEPKWSILAP